MLFKPKHYWHKEILLILLTIVFMPPFSASSIAYDISNGYFRFRSTHGHLNFTCTRQYVNVSGNMTLLPAQMWIPRDEYPADPQNVRLFLARANNEIQKREWYWNKHFLTYAEQDLNQLLSEEFPEIFLRKRDSPAKSLHISSVFGIYPEGDSNNSSFYPGVTGIFFNVTYLPSSMSYYVVFFENATSNDWENLERWEATASLLEAVFRSKWYIDNCTITYSGGCIPSQRASVITEFIIGITIAIIGYFLLGLIVVKIFKQKRP